jgi:hypothetical protein
VVDYLKETSEDIIRLGKIRTDGGTQARVGTDQQTVEGYAADIEKGDRFPPIVVFFDGEEYWLADGFHRLAACAMAKRDAIGAIVKQGTRRDAVLYSCGANAANGLRRTNADKRRAVELLLGDDEWGRKSDRWIAEKCGVGHAFVSKLRPQLSTVDSSPRQGQDGKTRKQPERKQPDHATGDRGMTHATNDADETSRPMKAGDYPDEDYQPNEMDMEALDVMRMLTVDGRCWVMNELLDDGRAET